MRKCYSGSQCTFNTQPRSKTVVISDADSQCNASIFSIMYNDLIRRNQHVDVIASLSAYIPRIDVSAYICIHKQRLSLFKREE